MNVNANLIPSPHLASTVLARAQSSASPHISCFTGPNALICQDKNREQVCQAIGKQIFHSTGVCCRVGGIRYSPLTNIEEQALGFGETSPADERMSYDEWQAVRIVKCVAALKLMRCRPPLFFQVALATGSLISDPSATLSRSDKQNEC